MPSEEAQRRPWSCECDWEFVLSFLALFSRMVVFRIGLFVIAVGSYSSTSLGGAISSNSSVICSCIFRAGDPLQQELSEPMQRAILLVTMSRIKKMMS